MKRVTVVTGRQASGKRGGDIREGVGYRRVTSGKLRGDIREEVGTG